MYYSAGCRFFRFVAQHRLLSRWQISESLIRCLNNYGIAQKANYMAQEEELPRCEKCGNPIDDCKCACPYCGETSGCDCCTGYGKATGG